MTWEPIIDYIDILEKAEECTDLGPKDENFLREMRDRYQRYGNRADISFAQRQWLERLAARASLQEKEMV